MSSGQSTLRNKEASVGEPNFPELMIISSLLRRFHNFRKGYYKGMHACFYQGEFDSYEIRSSMEPMVQIFVCWLLLVDPKFSNDVVDNVYE